jgi:secretion/DNA translocation related TadE-like protein
VNRIGVRADRGSGSVLALAILLAFMAFAVAVTALGAGLVVRQRVIAAADGAALAAADTLLGVLPGVPCDAARRVAEANGALLVDCELDGLTATVETSARVAGVEVRARSRAGPPR